MALQFCVENFPISVLSVYMVLIGHLNFGSLSDTENFLENLGKLSGGHQRKILSKWRERNASLNCKIKALFKKYNPFQSIFSNTSMCM